MTLQIFVIHRFKEKRQAKITLKKLARDLSIEFQPIFLDSSGDVEWKQKATEAIRTSEAVIVFNSEACQESYNAKWEIKTATETGKKIIEINSRNENTGSLSSLRKLYELEEEFESCFSSSEKEIIMELYKLMLDSSESLMERRQKVNVFFISVIGLLFTIAGILVNMSENAVILFVVYIIGWMLCNSWRNQIDNYGKLNKAKFDVISRLEKEQETKIYSAEWIALGEGKRPEKYKSFTETEKKVPIYFRRLIAALMIITIIWQFEFFKKLYMLLVSTLSI